MSVKIMGQVWDLDLPHNKLIVLLAMADHADHQGSNVYPSQGLIAWKTGYSIRTIRRIIKSLEKDGLLVLESENTGSTKRYSIDISKGKHKKPFRQYDTPDKMSTPDTAMSYPPRTQLCPIPPDTAMSYEPSYNHQKEPSKDGGLKIVSKDHSKVTHDEAEFGTAFKKLDGLTELSAGQVELFKTDYDDYPHMDWIQAMDTLSRMNKRDGIKDEYAYLIGILKGMKSDRDKKCEPTPQELATIDANKRAAENMRRMKAEMDSWEMVG